MFLYNLLIVALYLGLIVVAALAGVALIAAVDDFGFSYDEDSKSVRTSVVLIASLAFVVFFTICVFVAALASGFGFRSE